MRRKRERCCSHDPGLQRMQNMKLPQFPERLGQFPTRTVASA